MKGMIIMTNREAYEKDCDELEQYREIGTVEQCREAVEKSKSLSEKMDSVKEAIEKRKMNEIELRLCPFCGSKAVIHIEDGVRVVCTKCGAMSKCLVDSYSQGRPTGGALKSVVEAWNRRAGEQNA